MPKELIEDLSVTFQRLSNSLCPASASSEWSTSSN